VIITPPRPLLYAFMLEAALSMYLSKVKPGALPKLSKVT